MKQLLSILAVILFVSCQEQNEKKLTPTPIEPTDSLIANNYTLLFFKQDSFPAVKLYDDEDERKQLNEGTDNWYEKAIKVQKYLAAKHKDLFFITDSTLVLKLADGKTKSYPLVDTIKDPSFAFEQYFQNINYYLLRVQYNEGNGWMLVNKQNGFQQNIGGFPYISPNKKNILVINSDLDAQYSFNGIELYSITKDSLNLEFSKPTKWGATGASWKSDDSFLLKRDFLAYDSVNQVQTHRADYCAVQFQKKIIK